MANQFVLKLFFSGQLFSKNFRLAAIIRDRVRDFAQAESQTGRPVELKIEKLDRSTHNWLWARVITPYSQSAAQGDEIASKLMNHLLDVCPDMDGKLVVEVSQVGSSSSEDTQP